ncbi:uncharacterized protein [Montipora capricornis]|uniref:uncharacterized protein n=1 Tax=Montipora capricornis TaxID=246305 RepID=UPI0035F13E00
MNRVRKIQTHPEITCRHVLTQENPADLGSRGRQVTDNPLWWKGPQWLTRKEEWPPDLVTSASDSPETMAEAKATRDLFAMTVAATATDGLYALLDEFCYWKAIRERAREDKRYQEGQLQLSLHPNTDVVVECRGRIQGHYPVYLPDRQQYTKKLVEHAYLSTLRGGVGLTMQKIRERYWVPRLRKLAKRITRTYHGCRRFQVKVYSSPPPGNLPRERTEGKTPFQVIELIMQAS